MDTRHGYLCATAATLEWMETMKNILSSVLGLSLFTCICACGASVCKSAPHSNGQTIAISGTLHKEIHWGPPNFGENPNTDSKYSAWILHVDVPFKAVQDSKTGSGKEVDVSDIQLELSDTFSAAQIATLEEKHIAVEGRLWSATGPADVKDFNIAVKKASPSTDKVEISCL